MASVRNIILEWVQNFQDERSVENKARSETTETSPQQENSVSNYNRNTRISLLTVE